MVEVFKTNVDQPEHSQMLIHRIRSHIPNGDINFDLEDCDKILRIEGNQICIQTIIELMKGRGFECEVLN